MEYFSQYGQDCFVDRDVFHGKSGGFFVDIGAHDGVSLSNTLVFERLRGWKGICIEPIPERFTDLQRNRACICVNGCVAAGAGTRSFTLVTGYAEMLSGLSDRFDEGHRQRINESIREKGGTTRTIEVQCFQFNDLMEEHGVRHIDYCNIDTEGCEFEILQSMDLERFGATCYTVEDNGQRRAMCKFMASRGYTLVERLVSDLVFVRNDHVPLIGRVGLLKPLEPHRRIALGILRRLGLCHPRTH